MTPRLITIVGTGNAGLVHAAKLADRGHRVRLLATSDRGRQRLPAIAAGVQVTDDTTGRQWLARLEVTSDPAAALDGADVVIVATQTGVHEQVARRLADFIRPGTVVLVMPGYLGSVLFQRACPRAVVCETETTVWNGRASGGAVHVTFANVRQAIAGPVAAVARLGEVIGVPVAQVHPVESALRNPNLIVHTIGTLLYYHRLGPSFSMYGEAFRSEGTWALVDALDGERRAVLHALGLSWQPYLDEARWRNAEDLSRDAREVFDSFCDSASPGPESLATRYVHEDVPEGLVLLSSIGEAVGVATPVADGLIALGSALTGQDFRATGRTLARLGVDVRELALRGPRTPSIAGSRGADRGAKNTGARSGNEMIAGSRGADRGDRGAEPRGDDSGGFR